MGAKKSLKPDITIIGCGTPSPTPDRFGSAHLVDIAGEKVLFDCGPATTWKLVQNGIKPTDIDTVVFTHHHFDHDADFPTFILTRWDQMVPRDRELMVYGPTLTEEFTNGIIDEDYGLFRHDWKARVGHPGSHVTFADRGGILPRSKPLVIPKDVGPGVIIDNDRYRITGAPADHVQPFLDSLAYRIDTDEGSVVITGDTAPCDSVTELSRGADVMMIMCWESHDKIGGTDHELATCSIRSAAETAEEAGIKELVMVHIGARLALPENAEANEKEAREVWGGELVWGHEGMKIPWPK
jgi:ribonuclease Z